MPPPDVSAAALTTRLAGCRPGPPSCGSWEGCTPTRHPGRRTPAPMVSNLAVPVAHAILSFFSSSQSCLTVPPPNYLLLRIVALAAVASLCFRGETLLECCHADDSGSPLQGSHENVHGAMSSRRPLRGASTHRGRPGRRWRWCRRRPPGDPSGPSGRPPATWCPSPRELPALSAAPPPPRLHHTAAAPRPRCQPCERHRTVTTVPLPREYPRGPDRASLTRLRSQVAQLLELPLVFTSRGESHHKSQLSSNRTRTMFLCQNANDMARHDPVHWGGVHPHEASLPDSWASRKDG